MKKLSPYFVFALLLALCWSSLSAVAAGKRKGSSPVSARVHFSGNLEGELEPCG